MQGKYFFLVLMITYSQHIASSHILTSSYMDMSLPSCMRLLTYRVINDLCPTYAYVDYSSGKQLSLVLRNKGVCRCNILYMQWNTSFAMFGASFQLSGYVKIVFPFHLSSLYSLLRSIPFYAVIERNKIFFPVICCVNNK